MTRAARSAVGQMSHAYHGTWRSVGGSKPGG